MTFQTIGFLGATKPSAWQTFVAAFEQRLRDLDWIDGTNITIDYRWAEGRQERYDEIAKDFADADVNVIVTSGTAPVLAAKNATKKIPIIFASAGSAAGALVGGNAKGILNQQAELAGDRLAFLRAVVPGLKQVAAMGNVDSLNVMEDWKSVDAAASTLGLPAVTRVEIRNREDIETHIQELAGRVDGLYVCTDPLMTTHSELIGTLAVKAQLPTVHAFREYVEAGGLMSYGPDFPALFRRAAELVDQILRPTSATEKVDQPNKLELVINLETAKALKLSIPGAFLRAAIG